MMIEEDFELDFISPHKTVGKLISIDVLDKIKGEIEGMYRVILKGTPEDDWAVKWKTGTISEYVVIDIINK